MRGFALPTLSYAGALAAAAILVTPSPPAPAGLTRLGPQDDTLAKRLATMAELSLDMEELDALAVVVAVGPDVLLAEGWGRARGEDRGPVDADTRFPVGALGETFVAAAVLILVDEGELELDARVSSLVAELADWEQPVTLGHLLTHRSGLPHLHDLVARGEDDEAAVLRSIRGAQLTGEPGNCFELSNANTFLAGLVLARAAEAPLAEHLAARVFEPLGMDETGFCTRGEEEAGHVSCHELAGGLAYDRVPLAPLGAGCLCSTASDLLRFQRGLVEGELFGREARERFETPAILVDGTLTGRGHGAHRVVLDDEAAGIAYGGGAAGYRVHVEHYPVYDLTLVLISTDEDAALDRVARRLARVVLDLPQPEVLVVPVEPAALALYAGTYQTGCTQLHMRVEEERLVFWSWDGSRIPLSFQGRHRFVAAADAELRFVFEVERDRAHAVRIDDHGAEIRAIRTESDESSTTAGAR